MINKEQLQDLYKQKDNPLGIHFISEIKPVQLDGKTYLQIGYEWESDILIVLEETSGAVYEINNNKPVFINSDLTSFLAGLQYYQQYAQRKAADAKPVTTYSREEMLKRLEEMKNRTATASKEAPATKHPPAPKEPFNQKKEFKLMKAFLQQQDAKATKDENYWWSTILEQVEDDLL